ncbi:three-Cys-motif partner protein [Jatrophihabitans endophyticus]|uniref:Three-Cys-motif partner protein n=1 Tax=Jatrophihabitans endophyticus TaxID=1206085 RepID=A0A1M5S0R0_9ACTN|nr:three-Cys-motif partner protein TcmP [Jatrophihabitans endophyticus]SHH31603.1 three-Cys-motif partner protein [Jatrophihabitans endophyticus]
MPPRKRKPVELWDRPPHTGAKHDLLRSYLGAWFPIMAKYNGRVLYYDAFGGPGKYRGGEPGSPLIALQTLVEHSHFASMSGTQFVFLINEQDSGCAEHLEAEIEAFKAAHQPWPSNVVIQVNNETFVDLTTSMIDDFDERAVKMAPTFAFVDPVGVKETPMAVLARLSNYPKAEMLVYFAHEFVVRFCSSGEVDERLDDLFGTDEYKAGGDLTGRRRSQFIHDLYKRQLHDVCEFPYIQSFEMWDGRGKRLYDLYYCTHDTTGLDRMKAAMWKVAPSGDFSFRDRFADQDVIFAETPDTGPLRQELLDHFRGRTVTIQEVIDHVVAETPYTSSHVKRLTLAPMQHDGLISSPNQKRARQFPDGTLIQFPD